MLITTTYFGLAELKNLSQFLPPIVVRIDLSHITTELWVIPVLRMAH